ALMLHTPAMASAAAAHPVATPAAVVSTDHPQQPAAPHSPASITSHLNASAASAGPVYVVHHGDWLWYIAERFLGDPERYPEIAALNPGLITAGSGLHGPDHIEAGWQLTLPADANDRGARTHAAGGLLTPSPNPAAPASPV